MSFVTLTIKEYEKEDARKLQADLSSELQKIGIEISLKETDEYTWLNFNYESDDIRQKMSRGAGLICKNANAVYISVEECLLRMKDGETAEKIAEELGISRATLFRRLKAAKKRKISEISVYDTRKD